MATEDDDAPETGDEENLSDISKMQTGDPYWLPASLCLTH